MKLKNRIAKTCGICLGLLSLAASSSGCVNEKPETPAATTSAVLGQEPNAVADEDVVKRLTQLETACNSMTARLEELVAEQKSLTTSVAQMREHDANLDREIKTAQQLLIGRVEVEKLKYDRNVTLGAELFGRGEYDQAAHYFSRALEIHPNGYIAYVNRGAALQHLERWNEALVDFKVAGELDADNYVPWNNAAWLLATCPDDHVRNGKDAFSFATKAGELTDWKDAGVLGTLAAAHAERGEFDAALNRMKEAIEIAPKEALPDLLKQQTQLEARKPIRIESGNHEQGADAEEAQ
jgi:Flp pilus assembly protein TadD